VAHAQSEKVWTALGAALPKAVLDYFNRIFTSTVYELFVEVYQERTQWPTSLGFTVKA